LSTSARFLKGGLKFRMVFAGYLEIIPNSDPPVENRKMKIEE